MPASSQPNLPPESAVTIALQWVEADPLDSAACDAAARALEQHPRVHDLYPAGSAPADVLNEAAARILAAEVRLLRVSTKMSQPGGQS